MVALEERFMIREMYRKGVSISEIARRTGRDRKTIRQVVNAPELAPAKPLGTQELLTIPAES
jgi:transposase